MTQTAAGAPPTATPALLNQSRLVELSSQGTTLNQAASALLRQVLNERYPDLRLDPDRTMIATPIWTDDDQSPTAAGLTFESLTHALVRHSFDKTRADLIEGEHFLTVTPYANPPTHLAVGMDEVTSLLNDHGAFFFLAFAQQQLDYWNETATDRPRWEELSDALKNALDVQSATGWNTEECALARQVAQQPEQTLRQTTHDGFSHIRACLLDIDLVNGTDVSHLVISSAIVLTATFQQRELTLMYTIGASYESFPSLKALGESLPERFALQWGTRTLEWRLIEPQENIFDSCAWALINSQLDAIKALDPATPPIALPENTKTSGNRHWHTRERARLDRLEQAIPDWLHAGSISDFQTYSRHIAELGRLREEEKADGVQEADLPDIKSYAQRQMHDAIVADKATQGAASLPLDDLWITVTNSIEVAGLVLPNPLDQVRQNLGEFALQNTPPYQASLAFDDGRTVPPWLTVDYLTGIAEQVDIGKHYPRMVKDSLIDDPEQSAHHRARYRLQLPVLLPLLALECKLRHRGRVDERGYSCIARLMASITGGQPDSEHPVTLRPLAFMPRHRPGHSPDTVTNMYIIGTSDPDGGPCLLYRPLLEPPLMQFASAQNLLYAIYQPGELRESVLAWLPGQALSFEYAQYVFSTGIPSPWIIPQLAFEPFIHLDLTGPIELTNAPMSGDVLTALYDANCQALAELADRQSVSNAERRRTLLADSGWALFGVASNFIGGSAGTALWVWQTLDQIQNTIDANEQGNTLVEWRSTGDILVALGILLTQHVAARRNRSPRTLLTSLATHPEPPGKIQTLTTVQFSKPPALPTINFDANTVTDQIPLPHLTSVEPQTLARPTSGSAFIAMLERFRTAEPDASARAMSSQSHLYTLGEKSFAQVGARWFQVAVTEDEPVCIVDPANPLRTGLAIRYDEASARWHWDPRLRLRGGGPKGRIKALQRAKVQNREKAWAALHQFIEGEAQRKLEVRKALLDLPLHDTESEFEVRARLYLTKAGALGEGYTQALEQLEAWREAGGGGVFHQSQLLRMTAEQHRCLGGSLRLQMRVYAQMTEKFVTGAHNPAPVPRQEQIDIATRATALSDEMISRQQLLRHSMETLSQHSGLAAKVARNLERLFPAFTELDLKANEISMSYERCVREQPGAAMEDARIAISALTDSASNASHELISLTKLKPSVDAQATRIERLERLSDRFASLEQELEQLPSAYPGQLVQIRLDRVRDLVGEFRALAGRCLVAELPEREEQPAHVSPEPKPSTSQARVRISKTRPRQSAGEIASPEETSDAIEEIPFIKLTPARPRKVSDAVDVLAAAMESNLKVDEFNKKTRDDARRAGRIPADIRDIFEQQSTRLLQLASDVDKTLEAQRKAGQSPSPVASLAQELRDGARRTQAEGIQSYAAMLKLRKPRETYLRWLHDHGQIDVVKDERGRIRTRQRGDYFQEYRILDKSSDNKTLWVAHFHYDSRTDPDEQYTAAHLKFEESYLQTFDPKTRQALNTFDAVDNALRKIVDPAVRDLFLKP
ncbi:hypothetical protein N8H71_04585 [Pseudomonas koreensis]|uniref:dermonecrotic toxin domain-containing protein n=1 Tax=Pseudomonas koreensis TaxID=198620 RepID=UPI0021C9A230|nr:DUF6543 domain-containing protein [Pseudomonas koreensis]MCU0070849.1 hypothetical protein [Pseudomonas koreensis]